MARKDTVWGHRHKKSRDEVKRLQEEVFKNFKVKLSFLKADELLAKRSQGVRWSLERWRREILKSKGLL